MKLEILENIPNKLKLFEGKEIRTLVNIDTKELWFIAQDVLRILGNKKLDVSEATKDLDKDERLPFKMATFGGEQEMTIVSESGLYSLILRSRKPVAKPFQRFVTKEVLPNIRKNGFYISEEAKTNPTLELIKVAEGILDTRLSIDNTRDELIKYIEDYLINEDWNPLGLPNALSNCYQHLHIAGRGMISSQILEQEIRTQGENDGKLVITNFRQKRRDGKSLEDYKIAQNYLSPDEVKDFNKRLNFILTRVKTHIEFKTKRLSPKSVIALIKKASRDMVIETSDILLGSTYQGKNAKDLRDILKTYLKNNLSYQDTLDSIDKLKLGNVFILGKS